MRTVLVPNELSAEIYKQVDKALETLPHAAPLREEFYNRLLEHYDEYGVIPEFTIEVII